MPTTPVRVAPLAVCILLGLAACGTSVPPQAPTRAAPTAPTASADAPAPPAETGAVPAGADDFDALVDAANAALAADRMFAPPGDNALELLLRVTEARPDDARARQGLVDILPFVLIGLEQRLAAGDVAETERLLALFRRADPAHPALRRLLEQLDSERQRQALAEAARVEAELRRAARATAEPAAATTSAGPAPLQSAAPPRAAAASEPAASAPVSAASPEPARPAPAPPPLASPAAAPVELPPIVAQVPPRYPPQAQRRRIEGLVEVEFTVRADGSVADARVLRSEPAGVFDREALGAIQRWRFAATGREIVGRRVFDFRLGG